MKKWPKFNKSGDLPTGIHKASLSDVIEHFGKGSFQRVILGQRLQRIYDLAVETGQTVRVILFGSFVPTSQTLKILIYSS